MTEEYSLTFHVQDEVLFSSPNKKMKNPESTRSWKLVYFIYWVWKKVKSYDNMQTKSQMLLHHKKAEEAWKRLR